jgi:cold shock CspA family protein
MRKGQVSAVEQELHDAARGNMQPAVSVPPAILAVASAPVGPTAPTAARSRALVGGTKTERLTGEVETFDLFKGHGYVRFPDGRSARIKVNRLNQRSCWALPPKAKVTCLVEHADGGLKVRVVFAIDWSDVPIEGNIASGNAVVTFDVERSGNVKFFSKLKGYGFIALDEQDLKDVYFRVEAWQRGGQTEDPELAQRVTALYNIPEDGKPFATKVMLEPKKL